MRIGSLIHEVSRLRRQLYDERTRPLGITPAQWWALYHLARTADAPPTQADLAQVLEIGPPATGELIARLEKARMIRRTIDPSDRRARRIRIAPEGRAVLRKMADVALRNNEEVMTGFTADEADTFLCFLEKMKANILDLSSGRSPDDDPA